MKVLSVFGTRPEAIKLAPLIKLMERTHGIESRACVTAQHRQMLDQVLAAFQIVPDYDLAIMTPGQSLFDTTVRALSSLEGVLAQEKPDVVVVQGDTTTAFVGSLAAFYVKAKVAHVEAGLRTGDKLNPFPEEINRRLADVLSDFYFAPTTRAEANLLAEGVPQSKVFVTGNTVIDALLMLKRQLDDEGVASAVERRFAESTGVRLDGRRMILATGHRRESFGAGIENLCLGLKMIGRSSPETDIVYAVHLNPNVLGTVRRFLGGEANIHLVEPQDYATFVWLMARSHLIITDSGGIQEEAPALGKPVLVARQVTERPEAIEAGVARLVGTDAQAIFEAATTLLTDEAEYTRMAKAVNPFGDGRASERIVDVLLRSYQPIAASYSPALQRV